MTYDLEGSLILLLAWNKEETRQSVFIEPHVQQKMWEHSCEQKSQKDREVYLGEGKRPPRTQGCSQIGARQPVPPHPMLHLRSWGPEGCAGGKSQP